MENVDGEYVEGLNRRWGFGGCVTSRVKEHIKYVVLIYGTSLFWVLDFGA